VYRPARPCIEGDTSCGALWTHQVEPSQLTVQVRALDPQHLGGVGNPAVVVLKNRCNVVPLETGARLTQCGVDADRADAQDEA